MSSNLIASGVVYLDPANFYPELGATRHQGLVPVFAEPAGGASIGSFDIVTGEVTVNGRRSETDTKSTVVAGSDGVAP
jgi:hypothetical protein